MPWPTTPGQNWRRRLYGRLQLFCAALFFLVAGSSLGAVIFFAKRLFGFEAPDVVRVFVNCISGVKIYNQNTRQGSGFLPNRRHFLDTIDDPPRVSVRRRMIQTIAAVAARENEYDRWYVLAVWSRVLMVQSSRASGASGRMRNGPGSPRGRHDDCGGPSSDTV